MKFIDNIVQHHTRNGTIDKTLLFEPPFTDRNDQGLLGIFDEHQAAKIIGLVDRINRNAEVG